LLKIAIFEILANFDAIFTDEGMEIAKFESIFRKYSFPHLFKYEIRFAIPFFVVKIYAVKETSLFSVFRPFLAFFWYNWPTSVNPNFPKFTSMTLLGALYLPLKNLVDTVQGSLPNIPITLKNRPFLSVFFDLRPPSGK